ncbi:MAG TPA: hypothetical protein VGE06_09595 [Flavisolibacter sp.]
MLLGEMACPHCGDAMQIKTDKNGDPFGHCGACRGQLRVGGSAARVSAFLAKNPKIAAAMGRGSDNPKPAEKPVTDTGGGEFNLFS